MSLVFARKSNRRMRCMNLFIFLFWKEFNRRFIVPLVIVLFTFGPNSVAQEKLSDFERDRNREMLSVVKQELVRHYFDPTFRGVNNEEKYKTADELLKKVSTNSEAFYVIAAFLRSLDDSHTNFMPPSRTVKIEHGWKMQMIGDKCYVVAVRAGSLAEKDGLRQGDQILTIERFVPTREDF